MISQTAEYALRAIAFLATQIGTPRTTAHIARHTRVPVGYLAKVMQSLGRAGLVYSQRGLQGGFVLALDPTAISVWQVISAVEPSRRIKSCPLGKPAHIQLCPLHRRLDDAAALIEASFRKTSMQELIDPPKTSVQRCTFPNATTANGRQRVNA